MTEDGPVTYTVPMAVWDHVESLLKRLVGMSERRGATPLTYEVGDPYLETITAKVLKTRISGWRRRRSYLPISEDTYGRMVRDVTVAHWPGADTPWTILGTVEPANPNESGSRPGVWRAAPDEQGHEDMPSYVPTVRTREGPAVVFHDRCDHCTSGARGRLKTVLLRHKDTGEVRNIGTSCLFDYMGVTGDMAMNMVNVRTLMWDGFSYGGRRQRKVAEVTEAVRLTMLLQGESYARGRGRLLFDHERMFVDEHGGVWTPPNPRATTRYWNNTLKANQTSLRYAVRDPDERPHMIPTIAEEHIEVWPLAAYDLPDRGDEPAWFGTPEGLLDSMRAATGSFGASLRAVLQAGVVTLKTCNLFMGAISGYRRNLKREAREALAERLPAVDGVASEHIGSVGDKVTLTGEVTAVRPFDGSYGRSNAVSFVTTEGNHVSWFTTAPPGLGAHKVTGKVKRHGEFRGNKQTTLGGRVRAEVVA